MTEKGFLLPSITLFYYLAQDEWSCNRVKRHNSNVVLQMCFSAMVRTFKVNELWIFALPQLYFLSAILCWHQHNGARCLSAIFCIREGLCWIWWSSSCVFSCECVVVSDIQEGMSGGREEWGFSCLAFSSHWSCPW